MNVEGKISVFVEKREGKAGKYNIYSGSISHKYEDGTYLNAKIELVFDSNFPHNDKLNQLKEKTAYQMEIKGWLDCKTWEYQGEKQYRIFIHVKEATILSSKEVSTASANGQLF